VKSANPACSSQSPERDAGARREAARYDLYEIAAQSPIQQAKFLRAVVKAAPGEMGTLGEDFSGAGAIARAWVSLDKAARAVCVDADEGALAQLARKMRQLPLDAQARIEAHHGDALRADAPVDVIAALNFSICELKTRQTLLAYFRQARRRLTQGGAIVLDIYGGADAFARGESEVEVHSEEREAPAIMRYIWEQREADPATGRVVNAMHFFPADGDPIRDAFVYDWRLWSLPELRDALADTGFTAIQLHDRMGGAIDDAGDLHLAPMRSGLDLDDNFVVYVVGHAAQEDDGAPVS